jgi:hypothetical protein
MNKKIAKELLDEINAYLKTAKVQKKAQFGHSYNSRLAKLYFGYWALIALTKLKEQQAVELKDVTLPSMTIGDPSFKIGEEVFEGGRRRRKTALSKILDTIFSKAEAKSNWQSNLGQGLQKKYDHAQTSLGENARTEGLDKANAWVTAEKGHGITVNNLGRKRVDQIIQNNTKNTGNLTDDVLRPILVVVAILNKASSWVVNQPPTNEGGQAITHVNLDSEQQRKYESEAARKVENERYDLNLYNEDELMDLISMEGYDKFVGQATTEDLATINSLLHERGVSADPEERDRDLELWAEKYEEEMVEENGRTFEAGDLPPGIPQSSVSETVEVINELSSLKVTGVALKELNRILNTEPAHWFFDNQAYLDDWSEYTQGFDADAMQKIDALIEVSGQKSIPIALRYFMDMDKTKFKAFIHFLETCIEKRDRGVGNSLPLAGWIFYNMVKLKKGFTFKNRGRNMTIKPDNLEWPNIAWYAMVCRGMRGATEAEKVQFKKDIASFTEGFVPGFLTKMKSLGDKLISISELDENKMGAGIKQGFLGTSYNLVRGIFFSKVASEMIRYRYYMDLEFEDATGDLVPPSLGKPECDKAVKTIIPALPHSTLNRIKELSVEDTEEEWAEKMSRVLNKRMKLNKKNYTSVSKDCKALFKSFGVEEDEMGSFLEVTKGLSQSRTKRYQGYEYDYEVDDSDF